MMKDGGVMAMVHHQNRIRFLFAAAQEKRKSGRGHCADGPGE
jgi:hypothetical protein